MEHDNRLHVTVRAALDALARGDKRAWLALFADGAELYDDGSPRSLEQFSDSALGHEHFTHIERVENGGLDVLGQFHSDQWGDFRTYFKFTLNRDGKVRRLDIGQATP